jgi:hypothetical protein
VTVLPPGYNSAMRLTPNMREVLGVLAMPLYGFISLLLIVDTSLKNIWL